jgi:hypothetical protein
LQSVELPYPSYPFECTNSKQQNNANTEWDDEGVEIGGHLRITNLKLVNGVTGCFL